MQFESIWKTKEQESFVESTDDCSDYEENKQKKEVDEGMIKYLKANRKKRKVKTVGNKFIPCSVATPEEILTDSDKHNYYIVLADGGCVTGKRDNKHWFAMWRWLQDCEVEAWTLLPDECYV